MEEWMREARSITAMEAEIVFLLKEDFYFGPDSFPEVKERAMVEPLPSPRIEREIPSVVSTIEVLGHELELADYYREVIRLAKKHEKPFQKIEHYFWVRFWLWNSAENLSVAFPWYDTVSEVDRFFQGIESDEEGELFWDADQGWQIDCHRIGDELFIRSSDPDTNTTIDVISIPRQLMLDRILQLRQRTNRIVKALSDNVGRDLWSRRVDWPDFVVSDLPKDTHATPAVQSASAKPWWHFWK